MPPKPSSSLPIPFGPCQTTFSNHCNPSTLSIFDYTTPETPVLHPITANFKNPPLRTCVIRYPDQFHAWGPSPTLTQTFLGLRFKHDPNQAHPTPNSVLWIPTRSVSCCWVQSGHNPSPWPTFYIGQEDHYIKRFKKLQDLSKVE